MRSPEPVTRLSPLGEYVIEICQAALDKIVSYAREYHGSMDFVDNPAYRFMTSPGLWDGPEGRRFIRRSGRSEQLP